MDHQRQAPAQRPARRTTSAWNRWPIWIGGVVLLLLLPLGFFANKYWPFRYRIVKPLLESTFASQVEVKSYHRVYFPRPGFVADGITLRRKSNDPKLPPIGRADHLLVEGGWLDLLLLRNRVELVDVSGMQVVLPPAHSKELAEDFPPGSSADFAGPTTTIVKIVVHDASFEVQREGQDAVRFPVAKAVVHNVQRGAAIRYEVDMQNWKPVGHIQAHGHFGPLVPNNLAETPLDGEATFDQVQFSGIDGLHGVLGSTEHFHGNLQSIEADATSEVPDFAVGGGKPTHVAATVHATVNALHGDVVLHTIDATVNERSHVRLVGSVAGSPKVTRLSLSSQRGRVQDWLRPFLHDRSPLTGPVELSGDAVIAAGKPDESFLSRLQVEGRFNASGQRVTKTDTEKELSGFSQRAQGNKDDDGTEADVLSSLQGPLAIRNGVVSTTRLDFSVPGADAMFHGTYGLKSKQVHMDGTLRMEADLSHVTTGWKSYLLKPLASFFHRKNAGAVVPIALTGGLGNYKVSQNLLHTK